MTSSRPVVMKSVMIPKNSSVYGVKLDSRMLDKILYIVGKSDIPYNYYNLFYHPSYR